MLSERYANIRSMGRRPRFTEPELRMAVAESYCWSEVLRRLDYCPGGGNPVTIKKYVAKWEIDPSHFDPDRNRYRHLKARRIPLEEILVKGSTYSRSKLKHRLYSEGLKQRRCELCGQGEQWRQQRMALILDHINGVRDDNRLENLRIVCPNCAATLPTHCGRGLRIVRDPIACRGCGCAFVPKTDKQTYCSRSCAQHATYPQARKVDRPPHEQLKAEIEASSYLAVGRKYGVSDNAIRKWIRTYERAAAREAADSDHPRRSASGED